MKIRNHRERKQLIENLIVNILGQAVNQKEKIKHGIHDPPGPMGQHNNQRAEKEGPQHGKQKIGRVKSFKAIGSGAHKERDQNKRQKQNARHKGASCLMRILIFIKYRSNFHSIYLRKRFLVITFKNSPSEINKMSLMPSLGKSIFRQEVFDSPLDRNTRPQQRE